jgi:hypothetical protein
MKLYYNKLSLLRQFIFSRSQKITAPNSQPKLDAKQNPDDNTVVKKLFKIGNSKQISGFRTSLTDRSSGTVS